MKAMTCRQLGGARELPLWKHPIAGVSWYRQVKRDFAAVPDSGSGG